MMALATWATVIVLGAGAPAVFIWFLWDMWRSGRGN